MIAYLIVAHHRPQSLRQLVDALQGPDGAFFVHIDRKSDLNLFAADLQGKVEFIEERVAVYWGGWSQVQATLNLIRHALADPRPFTHFVLLSGEDYPLVRTEVLNTYLAEIALENISCVPMPSEDAEKPLSRLLVRHLEGSDRNSGLKASFIKLINKILKRLPDRNITAILKNYSPHAGSNWWVLSREMVEASLRVAETQPKFVRLYRYSLCPDEGFFQTVVAANCRSDKIGRSFTYTDWSVPNPPATITEKHVELVTSPNFRLGGIFGHAPCLFVRKFPSDNVDLKAKLDNFARERNLDANIDRPTPKAQ